MRSENFRAIVDEFELAKDRESKLRGLCERAEETLTRTENYLDNLSRSASTQMEREGARIFRRDDVLPLLADLRRELEEGK